MFFVSVNQITLKGINKKLEELGNEPAALTTVVDLLRQACEADATYRDEKIAQITSLMNCAHSNVQDKLRLSNLKQNANNDQELLAMIRQNEQQLDTELFEFCQTFNTFCRLTGVVQYFSSKEDREKVWTEMTDFFMAQQ